MKNATKQNTEGHSLTESGNKKLTVTCLTSAGKLLIGWLKFFTTLWSMNDHKSTTSSDFGTINKCSPNRQICKARIHKQWRPTVNDLWNPMNMTQKLTDPELHTSKWVLLQPNARRSERTHALRYHFYKLYFCQMCIGSACLLSYVQLFTIPARPLCPWDSSGKNTGVGCHALPEEGFSWPREQTSISWVSCTAGRFFTTEP